MKRDNEDIEHWDADAERIERWKLKKRREVFDKAKNNTTQVAWLNVLCKDFLLTGECPRDELSTLALVLKYGVTDMINMSDTQNERKVQRGTQGKTYRASEAFIPDLERHGLASKVRVHSDFPIDSKDFEMKKEDEQVKWIVDTTRKLRQKVVLPGVSSPPQVFFFYGSSPKKEEEMIALTFWAMSTTTKFPFTSIDLLFKWLDSDEGNMPNMASEFRPVLKRAMQQVKGGLLMFMKK